MAKPILTFLQRETTHLEQAGLLRQELPVQSAPGALITAGKQKLINFTSSDYLGLSVHAKVKEAAWVAVEKFGVGVAAPRAVAGTLPVHTELEAAVAAFLGTDDALLMPSGYHANTGAFESLLSERDYLFIDEQAGASLADGVRLCRSRVLSYNSGDLEHLEDRLQRSRAARFRVIVTDGVFALDGTLANLRGLYDLADKYDAILAVDEAHGLGVLGASGKGTHEQAGVLSKIELVTGSFAHALGGGAGGFIAGRREIIAWLRQKSRPYLSSASLPAASAAAAHKALAVIEAEPKLRDELRKNVSTMREGLAGLGFDIVDGVHPIIALRVGDAVVAQRLADYLFKEGVYVMGFAYPVVPEDDARIRLQVSAAHPEKALHKALGVFEGALKDLKLA